MDVDFGAQHQFNLEDKLLLIICNDSAKILSDKICADLWKFNVWTGVYLMLYDIDFLFC